MEDMIIQMNNPILRARAALIEPHEIRSDKIKMLIERMHDALSTQHDGVALAAPQIGESYQIFVVAPFLFDKPNKEHLVYINPKILELSENTKNLEEGCLSCRWKIGKVKRSLRAKVEAYDEYGNVFREEAKGLLAHIFQHEIDHLEGILFIDKAENLRDMTQEEINEVLYPKK
jgi:peptide deformylase